MLNHTIMLPLEEAPRDEAINRVKTGNTGRFYEEPGQIVKTGHPHFNANKDPERIDTIVPLSDLIPVTERPIKILDLYDNTQAYRNNIIDAPPQSCYLCRREIPHTISLHYHLIDRDEAEYQRRQAEIKRQAKQAQE